MSRGTSPAPSPNSISARTRPRSARRWSARPGGAVEPGLVPLLTPCYLAFQLGAWTMASAVAAPERGGAARGGRRALRRAAPPRARRRGRRGALTADAPAPRPVQPRSPPALATVAGQVRGSNSTRRSSTSRRVVGAGADDRFARPHALRLQPVPQARALRHEPAADPLGARERQAFVHRRGAGRAAVALDFEAGRPRIGLRRDLPQPHRIGTADRRVGPEAVAPGRNTNFTAKRPRSSP